MHETDLPETSSRFEGADMRSVVAAIAAISVVGMGLGLTSPLISLSMERDGFSASVIGANMAIAGIAAIVAIPFVTAVSRRLGVVNTLVGCTFLAAICMLGFYATDPAPAWFLIRFVFSLCLAVVFVLSEFWINHSANEKSRGLILGIYGTVLSIGFAAGPAIVSFVGIDDFMPFGIGITIFVLASIPALLARQGQPVMEPGGNTPPLLPFLLVVPLATGAGFIFGAAEQSQLSLMPVYGTVSGMSTSQAALLLTVLGIGNVVFQMPLGIWSDRIADRRIILLICA
ncbi:MAG: MFS transporter, partial [Pseudomonadota bacterium]